MKRRCEERFAESRGAIARRMWRRVLLACVLLVALTLTSCRRSNVVVGSKQFNESVVLGDIVLQLVESTSSPVIHRQQIGGTQILWKALLDADIDVYPEYTGTITHDLLPALAGRGDDALRTALARQGVIMGRPLGFNNTYALGMRDALAKKLGIESIADLRKHSELRYAFDHEFVDRPDCYPAVRTRYDLPDGHPTILDHTLVYEAVRTGRADVIDLYSTDAQIAALHLRVLKDDRKVFPNYDAVLLWRADLAQRAPGAVAQFRRLEGRISARSMIAMNARVDIDRVSESVAAAAFINREFGSGGRARITTMWSRLAVTTRQHLVLVGISLLGAIIAGIPLGILAAKVSSLRTIVLGTVSVFYTIPSLALLVFFIKPLGLGTAPAVMALFLYSLLPIVRNTYAGLIGIPRPLLESARAMGLPARARLLRIELPLAAVPILAGIKTAAVMNVGMATLGALIGAGGYGQPIITGIRTLNWGLILEGAVPAAVMALMVQGIFEVAERWMVPRGMRGRA